MKINEDKKEYFEAVEKKLVLQTKNMASMICSDLTSEQKVYGVLSNLSYLTALIDNLLEPYKEDVKDSEMVKIAQETMEKINV